MTSCPTLPEEKRCPATYAFSPHEETISITFGETDRFKCGQECSGFVALKRGEGAFRWRLAFAGQFIRRSHLTEYYHTLW
jgi:hypothetical protein